MTTQDNCSILVLTTLSNYSSFGPAYESTSSTRAAQTVSGISIFLSFAMTLINVAFAQDAWALIHFLQLVLILPLIALAMSNKVKEFIASNAFIALSAYTLPLEAAKSIPLIKDLSFDQPDEYLRMLGWASGSTLVNNLLLLIIFLILGLIHLLFYILKLLTKNKENKFS